MQSVQSVFNDVNKRRLSGEIMKSPKPTLFRNYWLLSFKSLVTFSPSNDYLQTNSEREATDP